MSGAPASPTTRCSPPPRIARVRRALRDGGRVAVNISLEAPDDPVPGRIADRLAAKASRYGPSREPAISEELNTVLLASARREAPSALAGIAGESWSLARLSARRRRRSDVT